MSDIDPEPQTPTAERDRCVVVGIGASAGGLDAFKQFLQATPADSGLAFVLIQHLDPDHKSMMADLLSRYTSMTVLQIEDATQIRPNHVYMIPPNKFVTVRDGGLYLGAAVKDRGIRMPIDHFFRSLSEDRRELAIGIILSGTGSDGTLGLKEIKGRGGMSIVQEPETADYDGMPRSAMSAGLADFLLPIEKMPEVVVRYAAHPYVESSTGGGSEIAGASPSDYRAIVSLLRAHTKYDFRCYKKGTLSRRIQRRMGLRHLSTLEEYVELLRESPDEVQLLFKDLLINVTGFFRDRKAWSALDREVVAPLVARQPTDQPIRVWVAGCATGEEAYTLGILLLEQMEAQEKELELQIFATDLDADAIQTAREGIYPASIASDVPPDLLDRYFTEEGDQRLRVVKRLRESTVLAVQNLIGDPPFSSIDIITCRNVMIYLEPGVQRRMLQMFRFALAPRGCLFLGSSETAGREQSAFDVVSKQWRIYRKSGDTRRVSVQFPISPVSGTGQRPREVTVQSESRVIEQAKRALLSRFVPATVLIDRRYEVLYFHGKLGGYLEIPSGEPTHDLISMCQEGLRSRLRTAVTSAISQGTAVSMVAPRVWREGVVASVRVAVEPLPQPQGGEPLLLVSFTDVTQEDAARPPTNPSSPADAGDCDASEGAPSGDSAEDARAVAADDALRQLEHDLQATREDLQSTIEELETSNEELKASNEEVMSMNEELQSSNEELETSREELQSLNEELSTVNAQLEEKIGEVENANDDLTNLLSSTEIATVFLDTDLCIRRFTPATMELLHIIPSDVGRPIADLTPRFNDPLLLRDARRVLRNLTPVEKRVRMTTRSTSIDEDEGDDGGHASDSRAPARWFMRRVLPYRTAQNRIDGVVITFSDVTSLTEILSQLDKRKQQAAVIAHLGRQALKGMDLDELFESTCRHLAETIGTEYAKVLALRPGERAFDLRAGVGWSSETYDGITVPAGLDSQAGYTLQSTMPVIVDDLRTETRFSGPRLLLEHGVVSGISVPIGPKESPWGVLGAHSCRRMKFSADDANFVEALANLLFEASERWARADELRERSRELALVTDAIPALVAYCDRDLVYRFCNAAYREWFGIEPDDIIGQTVPAVIGSQAYESVRERVETVLSGERVTFEQELAYERGPARHVRVEYVPRRASDGAVIGFYAMVNDVTDRVAREGLRARLASIVENSTDAIIGESLDGEILSWNSAAEHVFGYSAEEMRGRSSAILVPDAHRREHDRIAEAVVRGESVEQFSTYRLDREQRVVPVEVTASPIRDQAGEIVGVSTIVRDVTEREARERSLREGEATLRAAKRAAKLGIHDYDVRSGAISWDSRVREIWGLTAEETVTFELFMDRLHPDDRETTQRAVDAALDPEGSGRYEAEYRVIQRGTGACIWVKATGDVWFEAGEAVRLVGTVQDTTRTHDLVERLEESDRRKDEFLATLGHELRNPLAAISHAAELLRKGEGGSEVEELLAIVTRQTRQMKSLLDDLLDIGRITRGTVALRLERRPLRAILDAAIEVVDLESHEGRLDARVDVVPADLELVADPVRLEQVMVNLLSNAVHHSPEGGRVEIRGFAEADSIVIEVEDSGVGLADARDARRIFDLFYQVRKDAGGLGVGLSLVKGLVELHGGSVEASSPGPGEGFTVRVRLPATLRPGEEFDAGDVEADVRLREDLSVLLVDDHQDALNALDALLREHCEVTSVTRGADAVEAARRIEPDVMLLDLALPDMSGFDVAAAVRAIPDLRRAAVIAMTGFGDAATSQAVRDAGFDAHVLKPVNVEGLLRLLARIDSERGPDS